MIDEQFNLKHCKTCKDKHCGNCQDGFKKKGGLKRIESGSRTGNLVWDPKGYMVIRYAQKRALDFLKSLLKTKKVA